jgi:formylmethanofuran dehydrogenase subunit E
MFTTHIDQIACVQPRRLNHTWADIEAKIDQQGLDSELKESFRRSVEFHDYAAPGLLIGVFMVDYALELLGASADEKLYSVCETYKCLPDPLQVMVHCTIGNHRLRVIPIGKFAITMNRPSNDPSIAGVRVFIDGDKIEDYPTLAAWFTKDPCFDPRYMGPTLIAEIFQARRDILSYEWVLVKVPHRSSWKAAVCPLCGEMVPDDLLIDGICSDCRSKSYYEKTAC